MGGHTYFSLHYRLCCSPASPGISLAMWLIPNRWPIYFLSFSFIALGFEKILTPSRDPSPPLPFWDKMRLLFHGRLTMCIRQMTILLHASLDPYNTTEEMELTWSELAMDWTNGKQDNLYSCLCCCVIEIFQLAPVVWVPQFVIMMVCAPIMQHS